MPMISETKPASSSPAPGDFSATDPWSGWMLALLLVIAMIAVLFRRRLTSLAVSRGTGTGRALRVIESVRLVDGCRLSVIHFRGREMLVGHSAAGARVLSDRSLESGTNAP